MKKILVVTKDLMAFRVWFAIVERLKKTYDIVIWAEGASVAQWREAGYPIAFEGKKNIEDYQKNPLDVLQMVRDVDPDIILAGLSNPIYLEQEVAITAKTLGIPTVFFSDTWGAVSRLHKFEAQYLLTIDHLDRPEGQQATCTWKIVGDPVLDELEKKPINPIVSHGLLAAAGDRKIILIVGQGLKYTYEMASTVIEGLRPNLDKVLIVPRLVHPKYTLSPEAQELEKYISTLPQQCLFRNATYNTDEIARIADVTVSCFSAVLRVAVYSGKYAVSVVTPKCMAGMYDSTRRDSYPLVHEGAVMAMNRQMNLYQVLFGPHKTEGLRQWKMQSNYRSAVKFKPDTAIRFIESVMNESVPA